MWLISFVKWSPLASIVLFSFVITLGLSLLYKALIPQQEYAKLKQRQRELQQQLKQARNDQAKLVLLQQEMLKVSAQSIKLTFKPMLITFLPLMVVFYYLKKLYVDLAGIGNIIAWGVNLPLVGTGAGWLLSYIIFSFCFGLILRKALKL